MALRLVVEMVTTLSPRRPPIVVSAIGDPRFGARPLRRSLLRILKETELCSVATVTRGGQAHISHLYFCWSPDLEFYFLSDPRSRHCRNLITNSAMAPTVYSTRQPWDRPGRGAQLWGRCIQAAGKKVTQAERVYARRFTGYARYRATASAGSERFQYRFYRFIPRTAKVLDEREFGGGVFVTAAIRRS